MIKIHQIYTHSPLRNFSYLIETSKRDLYCIDPFDAEQMIDEIARIGGTLRVIINTHEHLDHYCGNNGLVDKFSAAVWAHKKTKGIIPNVTRFLENGEKISISSGDDTYLEVLDTPGHTFAHLCLLLSEKDKAIAAFTGDTLFNAGVGNCSNGGDPEILFETIKNKLATLNNEVKLYPGHDYLANNLKFTLKHEPSNKIAKELLQQYPVSDELFIDGNMGIEKDINMFLRLSQDEIRKNINMNLKNTEKEVFVALRKKRDQW
jgi:hydroxyacylglutathione hydrolase